MRDNFATPQSNVSWQERGPNSAAGDGPPVRCVSPWAAYLKHRATRLGATQGNRLSGPASPPRCGLDSGQSPEMRLSLKAVAGPCLSLMFAGSPRVLAGDGGVVVSVDAACEAARAGLRPDFGILVLGRGKGSEELEAQGLVPKATADPRVQAGVSLPVDPRMPHWLAVQLVTHAGLTPRFVVMRPATVGVYEDCARAIAKDVRAWAKANEAPLIAARGN